MSSATNTAESHLTFQVIRSFADFGFRRVLVLSWHLFVSVTSAREDRERLFVIYCSRSLRLSSPQRRMPPKFDPSSVIEVFLRATGGEVGAASSLAPKSAHLVFLLKKLGRHCQRDQEGLEWSPGNREAHCAESAGKSFRGPLCIRACHQGTQEPPRDRKKVGRVKGTGHLIFE